MRLSLPTLVAARAHAEQLTFHIDSSQSYMTFAVDATDGTPLTSAQTPGSDTTALSGTFAADLTNSTLQFINSADIQEVLQAVDQSPLPGGAPGTAPAQFGLTAFVQDVVDGTAAAQPVGRGRQSCDALDQYVIRFHESATHLSDRQR